MHHLRRGLLVLVLFLAVLPAFTTPLSASAQAAKPSAATSRALDINTATPDQLRGLPGIGDAYAKRIIDGRPYSAKNQLTARGIIPQKTYDGIKDRIVAHAPKK
jgi:DNA uptake protein ComE-like DNA-binding protein